MDAMALLTHYRDARHRGAVAGASHEGRASNPLCGDEVRVWVKESRGRIRAVGFDGVGCLISQGGADMLAAAWVGMSVAEAAAMELPEVLGVLQVPVGPSRERCAMLPVMALRAAMV
jgi:nitrogen fixation protein NifU and related proteins